MGILTNLLSPKIEITCIHALDSYCVLQAMICLVMFGILQLW